jgi:hypothetical protein
MIAHNENHSHLHKINELVIESLLRKFLQKLCDALAPHSFIESICIAAIQQGRTPTRPMQPVLKV